VDPGIELQMQRMIKLLELIENHGANLGSPHTAPTDLFIVSAPFR
jgi:hypothetical protein